MDYPCYPEYKPSGVEWLGEVPVHWGLKRLKYIASHNDDILPETTDSDYVMQYVDISSVTLAKGIEKTEEYTFEKAPSRARRKVRDGDTIVSTVRTYLKAIAPIEAPEDNLIVSTGFAVIRPRVGITPHYLAYQLQTQGFVDAVVANSVGVSYPAINASQLVTLPALIPGEDEQRAIAAFLDRETARIDALIAKKQQLIELLAEKRAALISQAVTKGLSPDAPMKDSGVEWLGEIPAHWNTPPLYARYSVELGKMLNESRITGDHLVPYLRNVDVQWDAIRFDDLPGMDIPVSEYQRYTIRKSDLLVCEGGEVGRAAIVGEIDSVVGYQKALHRLRATSSSETPRFMYYTLYWAANTGVFNVGGVSTIAHLTGEQLRRYRFPKPPVLEQHAIADHLDRWTLMLDAMRAKVESAIEKLKEYRAAFIVDTVTGKIDVREAAEHHGRHSREGGNPVT